MIVEEENTYHVTRPFNRAKAQLASLPVFITSFCQQEPTLIIPRYQCQLVLDCGGVIGWPTPIMPRYQLGLSTYGDVNVNMSLQLSTKWVLCHKMHRFYAVAVHPAGSTYRRLLETDDVIRAICGNQLSGHNFLP